MYMEQKSLPKIREKKLREFFTGQNLVYVRGVIVYTYCVEFIVGSNSGLWPRSSAKGRILEIFQISEAA